MATPVNQPPNLEQLQRWLLAAITHPAGVRAGVASDEAQRTLRLGNGDLEMVVLPSLRMSAEQRLAVYQHAYFGRLIEALKEFFPCLSESLGEEVFTQFGVGYLTRHPSQSYTLHRLADRFAEFLEATRPTDEGADAWAGFWIDLARLELAIDRVIDAPGPENEPKLDFEQLTSFAADRFPEARLRLVTGMELLSFRFPVGEYYSAWKRGEKPAVPPYRLSYAALVRRDYIVRRYELTAAQFALLRTLATGDTVGEAIAAAAEVDDDFDSLAANLQNWFRQWAADEFFRGNEF